jgi:hypothetical protein
MKPFTTIAAFLFSVVALVHLSRLIWGWELTINDVVLGSWVSFVVFIVAGVLAWIAPLRSLNDSVLS